MKIKVLLTPTLSGLDAVYTVGMAMVRSYYFFFTVKMVYAVDCLAGLRKVESRLSQTLSGRLKDCGKEGSNARG